MDADETVRELDAPITDAKLKADALALTDAIFDKRGAALKVHMTRQELADIIDSAWRQGMWRNASTLAKYKSTSAYCDELISRLSIAANAGEGLQPDISLLRDAAAALRSALSEARRDALEEAAKVCDAANGRHFNLIPTERDEKAKQRRGAKVAAIMEVASAIRALKDAAGR